MGTPGTDEPEPRFAGSAPAGYQPSPARVPVIPAGPPPISSPPSSQGFEQQAPSWVGVPEVSYVGADAPPEQESRRVVSLGWLATLLAATGGIVAIVGSQLTWATLQLGEVGPSQAQSSSFDHITYNGMILSEGRVALVAGVVGIVLGILLLRRRMALALPAPIPILLMATGAAALVTSLFAALTRPVDLSALFRIYSVAPDASVRLPNGPGVWLALAGSALILSGGSVALLWRHGHDGAAPDEAGDQGDE